MSFFINKINDNEAILIRYEGNEIDVIIPESIDGLNIVEISSLSFLENEFIETITIPESINSIKENAIVACDKLRLINYKTLLKLDVDRIIVDCKKFRPYNMFEYELNLEDEIVINGFKDRNAKYIVIPEYIEGKKVTKINVHAFSCLYLLEEIVLSKYINVISNHAFYACGNLKNVKLSEELRVIRSLAFGFCKSLEFIELESKLDYIENEAFYNCFNLKEVFILEKFEEYLNQIFVSCPKLKKINFKL